MFSLFVAGKGSLSCRTIRKVWIEKWHHEMSKFACWKKRWVTETLVLFLYCERYNIFGRSGTCADLWLIMRPQTSFGSLHTHIDRLVQENCNSSVLAMELRLSCTNPTMWYIFMQSTLWITFTVELLHKCREYFTKFAKSGLFSMYCSLQMKSCIFRSS